VQTLQARDYTVEIKASGTVRARTQSNLVAEVAGRITTMSPDFEEGGYFDKGDVLLQVDTSDYRNAIQIAENELAASQSSLQQLATEEAASRRSLQLAQNNLRLGQQELQRVRRLWDRRLIARNVLDQEMQRINQLRQQVDDVQAKLDAIPSRRATIQANMNSARARVEREKLNLGRTRVFAPYEGRVLDQQVDIGQYVSPGTVLGVVYATDYVEVDLPLSLTQYSLLDMPEAFRDQAIDAASLPRVNFVGTSSDATWQGQVVRSAAALDEDTRQINVIARIDNPYETSSGATTPVRIGQYLSARIQGKTLRNVYVLPPVAVQQGKEILLLRDNKIAPQAVELLWNSETEMVVRATEDLNGEQVIVTALAQATPGMTVKTAEQQRNENAKRAAPAEQGGANRDKAAESTP